jgi:hypothetical protein
LRNLRLRAANMLAAKSRFLASLRNDKGSGAGYSV